MALNSETFKTVFACTGGAHYDATFKIFTGTDCEVIYIDTSGTETTLATASYSISLITETGFRVTIIPASYATGTLVVRRAQPLTQDLDYTPNDPLDTTILEEQLDKLVMMAQSNREALNRSVQQAANQTTPLTFPVPSASKVLAWNAGETALENIVNPALAAAVSAAAAAVSETNAGLSETAAAGSETNAGSYATNSLSAQTAAETARDEAVAAAAVARRIIILKPFMDDEAVTTGDGKLTVTIPAELTGMNLIAAYAHVYTAASASTCTIQIRNVTDSQDMLSTRITIDATEKDSKDAATPAVIDTTHDDVATGDEIAVDVDVAGTTTKGLEVRLTFQLP